MAELVATEKKPLSQILKNLEKQIGCFYTDRINIDLPNKKKDLILQKLRIGFSKIGKFSVEKFIKTDGFKFILKNDEWVCFRASGTEPVIRCYLEAKNSLHLKQLKSACRKILSIK